MAVVTREIETRDAVILRDEISLGGVVKSGEGAVDQYAVVMYEEATGKWLLYVSGSYAAGQKLAIVKTEGADATAADATVSLLLAGDLRREAVDAVETITDALYGQLMQSQIYVR